MVTGNTGRHILDFKRNDISVEFTVLEGLWNKVQKPARYTGGEMGSVIKDKNKVDIRYALCFPDLYEIGMSHLGSKILYGLINNREEFWCERVYAPDKDMEKLMREEKVPLYGLESLDSLNEFDALGFTLQYEMSYTGIINMLDLAGIPVKSSERTELSPIIMGGGPCACNPEPVADFFDLIALGEGEEVTLELLDLLKKAKANGWSREEYLVAAAQIEGVYVPELYDVSYNEDGTINEVKPLKGAPSTVKKRIVEDISSMYFPENFVVPYIRVVHDRTMLEVLRGCIHGCRFCQAGFIYRPYREKSPDVLNCQAMAITENTGYEEISLTSLSTSDHSGLDPLLRQMLTWTEDKRIGISLPSLRIDNFPKELLEKIASVKKSGLTFAPEAGTQRMRDVINKNITEQEVMRTCKTAFEGGYTSVKLYFMLGLPTETKEDIKGIADLAQKVVDLFYETPNRAKGKSVSVTLSTACFVPKPFTPFQFEPQDTMEEFMQKQAYLKSCIQSNKINYRYHDSPTSVIEAVLARGDRRLGEVIYKAWQKGSSLDGWSEYLDMSAWDDSFNECGLSPEFYANRLREYDEVFPWSHLDYFVTPKYLVVENQRAHQSLTSTNCRTQCRGCGAARLLKGENKWHCK